LARDEVYLALPCRPVATAKEIRTMKHSWPIIATSVLCLSGGLAVGLPTAQAAEHAPRDPVVRDCGHPADVLHLTNWKETLPIGSDGNPTEITQPELATYSMDPWFVTNSTCDGVQFRAAVDGTTTSGSSYPRSELREMTNNGSASWSTTSGTHTMVLDEAITHLPNDKPQVVAGQIHGASDDITVFRLEGTSLYITNGNDPHYQLVTQNYSLGTRFTAKFVASGGQIKAYYNGGLVATLNVDSSGDYFKAGAYTQANCDKSSPCDDSNYGEVVIYNVTVSHQA
jgi:hypothetical protein